MKQIPILYSGEMEKAYFADLKTQTRRIRGLEEINKEPDRWRYKGQGYKNARDKCYIFGRTDSLTTVRVKCPFGQAGDVLVGRETFCDLCPEGICYKAMPESQPAQDFCKPKWKPSIHMFLKDSRIHQKLLCDPVPQRLWNMTEAEAIAEGMIYYAAAMFGKDKEELLKYIEKYPSPRGYISCYAHCWDSLNAARGYPWSGNFMEIGVPEV